MRCKTEEWESVRQYMIRVLSEILEKDQKSSNIKPKEKETL